MTQTVMLYDGLCGLCRGSVRLVRRLDRGGHLAYQDAQDWPAVAARFPALEQGIVLGLIHVITPDGRVHVGYDGLGAALGSLPRLRWLAWMMALPGVRQAGRWGYRRVAANRYLLSRLLGPDAFCEGDACHYPP